MSGHKFVKHRSPNPTFNAGPRKVLLSFAFACCRVILFSRIPLDVETFSYMDALSSQGHVSNYSHVLHSMYAILGDHRLCSVHAQESSSIKAISTKLEFF